MKKKLTGLVMAVMFTMGVVGTGWAASVKCEVEKIEGSKVILDCGSKAKELKVGSKVKLKKVKVMAIEGC